MWDFTKKGKGALCVSLPSGNGCNRVKNGERSWEEAGWLHSSPVFPEFLGMHECSYLRTLTPGGLKKSF